MTPISRIICFIFALLTMLSMAPAILLVCLCDFAAGCALDKLWLLMAGPVRFRILAIATVLGPPFFLLTFVLALRHCDHSTDVLDPRRHLFD